MLNRHAGRWDDAYAVGVLGRDTRWWLRITEGVIYLLVGAIYTFGPPWWHSSANFDLINALPVPFHVWSALLLVGGVALLIDFFPYNWVSYGFLLIVSLFWGLAQLFSVLMAEGPAPMPGPGDMGGSHIGAGGPVWVLGVAAFNLLFFVLNLKEYVAMRESA